MRCRRLTCQSPLAPPRHIVSHTARALFSGSPRGRRADRRGQEAAPCSITLGKTMEVVNEVLGTPDRFEAVLVQDVEGSVPMLHLLKFRETAAYEDGRDTSLTGADAYQLYPHNLVDRVRSVGGRRPARADSMPRARSGRRTAGCRSRHGLSIQEGLRRDRDLARGPRLRRPSQRGLGRPVVDGPRGVADGVADRFVGARR